MKRRLYGGGARSEHGVEQQQQQSEKSLLMYLTPATHRPLQTRTDSATPPAKVSAPSTCHSRAVYCYQLKFFHSRSIFKDAELIAVVRCPRFSSQFRYDIDDIWASEGPISCMCFRVVYWTAVFGAAFAYEMAFDSVTRRIWDSINYGVPILKTTGNSAYFVSRGNGKILNTSM